MRFSTVFSLLLGLPLAFATCMDPGKPALKRVKDKFDSSGVVPVLIPSITPSLLAHITYGTKKVTLGNTFNSTQTLNPPTIKLTPEAGQPSNTTYSLFFINPDNPEPHPVVRSPFLHWQLSGLTPACLDSPNAPTTVEFYIPCAPPSVQKARYTFLIYREPPGFMPAVVNSTARAQFDPTAYAEATGLTLVGGNFLREGEKDNIPG